MRKKLLSAVLITGMMLSLSGCAKKSQEVISDMAGSNDILTVYAWDENFNIPALKAAEKDYKQVNPNFELNIVNMGNSDAIEDAIEDAYKAKDFSSLPDIVLFQDHSIQKYVKAYSGSFMSVEDAIVDWDNLGSDKVSYSVVNGVHYGFPVDSGTTVFAYRVDILEECGYTLEDVTDITWKEFDEIGKDVYQKTGKYLISAIGKDNDLIYMMLQAEGESQFRSGSPFIVGNEKLKEVVETIVQLANDNVLYLAEDWDDYVDNAIGNDLTAGVYDGNWIISSIQQNKANSGKWEITYAPTFTGIPGYASNGGSSLCVTSNCQNSMLAKDFLAYTFGGGSAIDGSSITYDDALLNAGVIGSCVAAAGSDVYTQGVEYFNNQPIYATIVEYSQLVPSVEQSDYHYVCRKYMSQAVLDIIENGTDIDEALATAEAEYKKEIEPKY